MRLVPAMSPCRAFGGPMTSRHIEFHPQQASRPPCGFGWLEPRPLDSGLIEFSKLRLQACDPGDPPPPPWGHSDSWGQQANNAAMLLLDTERCDKTSNPAENGRHKTQQKRTASNSRGRPRATRPAVAAVPVAAVPVLRGLVPRSSYSRPSPPQLAAEH